MRASSTCLSLTLLALALVSTTPAWAASPRGSVEPTAQTGGRVSTSVAITPTEAQTLDMLLALLPSRYESAHPLHDTRLAAPVRLLARAMEERVLQGRGALATSRSAAGARASA